jgi:hypothetical protein
MGIEVEATCSPQVERKVIAASTRCTSQAHTREQLRTLAEIDIGEKRCARMVQRVGSERVRQREQRLADYQALPLPETKTAPADAPLGGWDHRVAVVMADGGRIQLRDERWGTPRKEGEKKRSWWREPKVALVATFASESHDADPMPEVPECLHDPLWLIPRINAIKAATGGDAAAEEVQETASTASVPPADSARPADRRHEWSPSPLVRSVVSTLQPYAHLGRLAKVEAYHRGFSAASRKAFVADGLQSNWTIQQTQFSDYTPITDLMHALTYVYKAAKESTDDMEECWTRCQAWVSCVWQGKVTCVIDAIDELLVGLIDESVREPLLEVRGYLKHNQDRMKYDQYRRCGLPITTALMESTIKQTNRRMKGTEKFWLDGAEPQSQLCADSLSETRPLDNYWRERSENATGFRKSRTNR